jgi:hypothetical protein
MSQHEQHAAPPAATASHEEEYKKLQAHIHEHVQQIEKSLNDYYSKAHAAYFPDKNHRSVQEWSLSRTHGRSDLKVHFKWGHGKASGNGHSHVAPLPASPTTSIYAHDEIGTPPTGPTPPDPGE